MKCVINALTKEGSKENIPTLLWEFITHGIACQIHNLSVVNFSFKLNKNRPVSHAFLNRYIYIYIYI